MGDTTDTTSARGPLMPNPRLMLMLLPTMFTTDTADTDTVWDTMVDTTAVPTDTVTLARGLLMPNLRLMLMPLPMPTMVTTDTVTDTDTTVWDTVDTMAILTVMDITDTASRFLT